MPKHGDAAVRRFVILGELPLAGHADGTELDGASIGIEPLEILFGGKPANFIESILDRFFSLKHGAGQRHGDFDGDGIYGLASDLCGHGISSVKTPATTTLSGRRHRYLVETIRVFFGFRDGSIAYLPKCVYIILCEHPWQPAEKSKATRTNITEASARRGFLY